MLTPSIGVCTPPVTLLGSGIPAASSTVGATSTTWWNWLRISPFALTRLGQVITSGFRVPPKLEATCLVQMKGVAPATAHPTPLSSLLRVWGPDSGATLKYVIS